MGLLSLQLNNMKRCLTPFKWRSHKEMNSQLPEAESSDGSREIWLGREEELKYQNDKRPRGITKKGSTICPGATRNRQS